MSISALEQESSTKPNRMDQKLIEKLQKISTNSDFRPDVMAKAVVVGRRGREEGVRGKEEGKDPLRVSLYEFHTLLSLPRYEAMREWVDFFFGLLHRKGGGGKGKEEKKEEKKEKKEEEKKEEKKEEKEEEKKEEKEEKKEEKTEEGEENGEEGKEGKENGEEEGEKKEEEKEEEKEEKKGEEGEGGGRFHKPKKRKGMTKSMKFM